MGAPKVYFPTGVFGPYCDGAARTPRYCSSDGRCFKRRVKKIMFSFNTRRARYDGGVLIGRIYYNGHGADIQNRLHTERYLEGSN